MSCIRDQYKLLQQYLIPHHLFSRINGILSNCRWSWFKNWSIRRYIKLYGVDLSEAQITTAEAYESVNDLFTRRLKPEARPIVSGANAIASPADGAISQVCRLEKDTRLHIKGADVNITELLGGDTARAEQFAGGGSAIVYLSPKDYHRVHMPLSGRLKEMVYVPGKLFSVSPFTVANIPNLFTRNERVVSIFDTVHGPMAVVLVGAMIVASMETVWAGSIAPTKLDRVTAWQYDDQNITLAKGAEMGHFRIGSTVAVIMGEQLSGWLENFAPGNTIRMGEHLGNMLTQTQTQEEKSYEHSK